MAYTPNNINIFAEAFAGAVAAFSVSAPGGPTLQASYGQQSNASLAFAIAVDTAWGTQSPNEMDVAAISDASALVLRDRAVFPIQAAFTQSTNWTSISQAIVAAVKSGDVTALAAGIIFPPVGGGGPVTSVTGTAPIQVTGAANAPVVGLVAGTVAGQLLGWNGTVWAAVAPPSTTLAGDVVGPGGSNVLENIQGHPISAASPSTGNVLAWSGAAWVPSSGAGPTITLAGDVTGASNANTVTAIQGNPVSGTPTAAQILIENGGASGSAWQTLSQDVTISATGVVTVNAIHGTSPIPITPSNLAWAAATATPTLLQTATATASAVGATMTIQAQNATGTTSTGGALALTSGTGTTVAGTISLQTGGVSQLTASPTTLTLGQGAANTSTILQVGGTTNKTWTPGTETWAAGVASPLYTQAQQSTDAPANSTTIQSQAAFSVALSGTFNVTNGSPDVTSTTSGVVTNGQVIVFAEQPGVAYTVSAATGTAIVLTGNYTGTSLSNTTAIRVSATVANQANGSLVLDSGVPNVTGQVSYTYFKTNGFLFAAFGQDAAAAGTGLMWLSQPNSGLVPSTSNYVFGSSGSTTFINSMGAGGVEILVANSPNTTFTAASINLAATGSIVWATALVPSFTQTALGSTSAGSGVNGKTWTFTAQAGQAATGASNNGGNGGTINISSGALGTSGSATAGIPGQINLQQAGTTVLGIDGSGLYVEQSTGISTAGATITPSAAQLASPYLVLTGTTATPSCTITIAASPNSNTSRFWYVDISAVTLSTNSIIFTAGTGATTATITAATAISKVLVLFQPTANTLYLLGI